MIRRKIAIVLLSLGTVVGYASGFASLACHHHREARQQRFEQHVARVCVDAARASQQGVAEAPGPGGGRW